MDDTFGGMSADEFFLLHNAFVDEDEEEDDGLRCKNCIHCDDNGWCDIKGDYVDTCYNDCEDFES